MIVNKPGDVVHKIQLLRLLTAIVDDPILAASLYFKGGTCAAMSGFLDRFSVDLDFDISADASEKLVREHFKKCFTRLDMRIDTEGNGAIVYALKYQVLEKVRNTIHIDAMKQQAPSTTYEQRKLSEIDRIVPCQTRESTVSHKLVAPLDRFSRHNAIAGRDVYDIHQFFIRGYSYIPAILTERTGYTPSQFFEQLISLFDREITGQLLDEDLNTVLSFDEFRKIRKILKQETLLLLRSELQRIQK